MVGRLDLLADEHALNFRFLSFSLRRIEGASVAPVAVLLHILKRRMFAMQWCLCFTFSCSNNSAVAGLLWRSCFSGGLIPTDDTIAQLSSHWSA